MAGPVHLMQFQEAIQFLYDLQFFGAKLGLENVRRLARLAGDPQDHLNFIHVAGTNGKGSVCALLESIYRSSGMKVGMFTSPHLIHFGERIQVDRQLLEEPATVDLVQEMKRFLEQGAENGWWSSPKSFDKNNAAQKGGHPTFFEVVTVMALVHFRRQQCDLVIWETGMGGRLDATNIVVPMASVITTISCEHQRWLGDRPAKIAAEKGGIIKPGVPVVTGPLPPEAQKVVQEIAFARNAPWLPIEAAAPLPEGVDGSRLRTSWQRVNAALAIRTVQALAPRFPVSESAMKDGVNNCFWPCRFQVIHRNEQVLIVDGAHNPAGAAALAEAVQTSFPQQKALWILGFTEDKNAVEFIETILPLAEAIWFVPIGSNRSADPKRLAVELEKRHPGMPSTVQEGLSRLLNAKKLPPLVVVSGSLYLAGEAVEILAPPYPSSREHRLMNDWKMGGR